MVAEGHKECLCDLSNIVAFGHSELWWPKATKVATKLARMSPNGNIAGGDCSYCRAAWYILQLNSKSWCCCMPSWRTVGAFGYEWLLYYFMNVINIRYWWLNSTCVNLGSSCRLMRLQSHVCHLHGRRWWQTHTVPQSAAVCADCRHEHRIYRGEALLETLSKLLHNLFWANKWIFVRSERVYS